MGEDPKRVMAELYGKETGTSKGMGGSMHIFSKEHRFYGGHGIVGGQIPLGAGLAFADKYFERDNVTLTFFGDGAARQGSLHEAFNLAMLWNLPVVFCVENNQYAMGTSVERSANHTDIWKLGLGYEMPCKPVDAMNPITVAEAFDEAITRARTGGGPTFLELKTYRYRGHSMSDAQKYRTKEEVAEYQKIDPITQVLDVIKKKKYASAKQIQAIDERVKERVLECQKFAEESPFPKPQQMYDMVYEQEDYPFLPHKLCDTMEEGTVASWLKKVGDKVAEGDILAEIETDKATMEFESFYEGTLLHIGVNEGDTAPVDQLLCVIGNEGEDISAALSGGGSEVSAAPEEEVQEEVSTTSAEVPEGVEVITMPRLSDTMEEGTVASWLKKEGDTVAEGDILAEIETDKATMEFESFYSGTLLYVGVGEGETAPVESLLAIIGPAGTDVSGLKGGVPAKAASSAPKAEAPAKVEVKETAPVSNSGGRVFASPLAKKIAADKGIDLSQVKGTGENGRVTKKDVESFSPSAVVAPVASSSKAGQSSSAPAPQIYTPVGEQVFEETKNSQMRKAIAKSLGKSKFTAPHYYLSIEVDMDNAMASRKQINELPDVKVSFNDMVVKASAMALRKHPQINTQWQDDVTKYAKHISIGVAVAVEDGLVVPVLPFTDQMTLTQIGGNVRNLAGKAKNKKLTPGEMSGSTFTVSNLGMFGITSFTSIINQPNSAILSVGAIVQKPVVKNGEIVVGNTMVLNLACDHRTVDGAAGAAFLQTLKTYLENPVTMLA